MAYLEAVIGYPPGTTFEIESARNVLGRSPECEINLDFASVSRHHAAITKTDGRYFVEDLGSRNGTFLNGLRVETKSPMYDGDRLLICDIAFDFRLTPASQRLSGPMPVDGSSAWFEISDQVTNAGPSQIMSKLEVKTDYGSVLLSANPESKLAAMIEISRNLGGTLSMEEILPRLLDSLFKIFLQADRAFVVLNDSQSKRLVPSAMRHRKQTDEEVVRISQTIARQAMDSREAILSADASGDQRFEMAQSVADFRIRSVMCAPMIDSEGNALGVIQVDTLNQRSRFTEQDLEVLASVASQAGLAVDNAQLHERAWQQKAIERDLELAHRVQRSIVPNKPFELTGYHFFHFYDAAYEVGGDYFDYILLSGGRVAIVVGDVAGKGVAAALLMAKLSGEIRYHLASEPNLAHAMRDINAAFLRNDSDDRFVTMVIAILDPREHLLTIANAGHMPPLLRHSGGTVEDIGEDESGLPLGVMDGYEYETYSRSLEPGDFLTIFTDGISEAMNDKKQLYGLDRISRQVGAKAKNVVSLGEGLLKDVRKFVGGQQQSDDMCLVCFGRDEE